MSTRRSSSGSRSHWFAAEPIELPSSPFVGLQARQYEGELGKGKAGKLKAAILRPRPLVQPSL
jgi:hypothetical protein